MEGHSLRETIIGIVQGKLSDAEAGHDWSHIDRVHKMSLQIARTELIVDVDVIEYAALLHDIADAKFHSGDESIGPTLAREILEKLGIAKDKVDHTVNIIENMSFKGGHAFSDFASKELDIVRDADRLDALGAIGIARAFSYGGFKGRKMYDLDIPPLLNMSREEYKKNQGTTINHFYEKLLLLKDKMKTKEGKRVAEERHRFLELFLKQFLIEINS